ncbi:MAG: hypothetical protein HY453_01100 [Parcubacteria group bacterium]|nr:hypothetical protein [Parcubacteria group bacterium]
MKKLFVVLFIIFVGGLMMGCVSGKDTIMREGHQYPYPQLRIFYAASNDEREAMRFQMEYALTYIPEKLRKVKSIYYCDLCDDCWKDTNIAKQENFKVKFEARNFRDSNEIHVNFFNARYLRDPFALGIIHLMIHEFGHSHDAYVNKWPHELRERLVALYREAKSKGREHAYMISTLEEYWSYTFADVLMGFTDTSEKIMLVKDYCKYYLGRNFDIVEYRKRMECEREVLEKKYTKYLSSRLICGGKRFMIIDLLGEQRSYFLAKNERTHNFVMSRWMSVGDDETMSKMSENDKVRILMKSCGFNYINFYVEKGDTILAVKIHDTWRYCRIPSVQEIIRVLWKISYDLDHYRTG